MRLDARRRAGDVLAATGLVLAGAVWRMAPLGLPAFWLRYGGSALWGAMVLMLVAAICPGAAGTRTLAGLAGLVAVASELFRLVHTPWLDAFRLTLPGALLLGRLFDPWHLAAYGLGIALALWLRSATKQRMNGPPE